MTVSPAGIKAEYRNRRDTLVDNLLDVAHASLDAREASAGVYEVSRRSSEKFTSQTEKTRPLMSFVAPVGGMFGGWASGRVLALYADCSSSALCYFPARSSPLVPNDNRLALYPPPATTVWLRVHFSEHRQFRSTPTPELLMSLWEDLAEHNVLIVPGTIFSAAAVGQSLASSDSDASADGYFRISFSSAKPDEMREACKILAQRVERFFRE